eukprot:TRINITY_DN53235_c0_g1_i1.p1 TRINITY_DN53235_c0_g1~~TRINITY_DN53235_c0_g1_i1.p1  ORF type:complete len:485 (+),score=39.05 TRINITY_DN53235_c0_g1_i1:189-1457(+)
MTLLSESDTFFHAMLRSGSWSPDHGDSFFVDRNPQYFTDILDYLRDRKLYLQPNTLADAERRRFIAELEFYGIDSLLQMLGEQNQDITGSITTLAGTGHAGYSGDGGAAIMAALRFPSGICFHDNKLFIAERNNHRVRMVDIAKGTIITIAGNGQQGCDGDGGKAQAARLDNPGRVAVGNDTLFVSDCNAHCIRAVNLTTGIITTCVGTSLRGYTGDGGLASVAQLDLPMGICYSDNRLYIADSRNHCIRMVDITSGIISTIGGNTEIGYYGDGGPATQAQLHSPSDLAIHHSTLFISDADNHCIRTLDLQTGTISTLAGTGTRGHAGDGGLAKEAMLRTPRGLAVHHSKLYIAEHSSHCVRVVDFQTGVISPFCGIGEKGYHGDGSIPALAQLAYPLGLAASPTKLFISDHCNHRIRVIGS